MMIVLRLLHIVLGALWVGIAVFLPLYLMPSLGESGPDAAARVMSGLQKRKMHIHLPIAAILTLLTGYMLYWKASAGFQPEFMGSAPGIAFGTGGLLATIAFLIGMLVARPSMTKAVQLSQELATAAEGERPAIVASIQRLRQRGASAGAAVAVLVVLALAAMAVARYL